MSACGDRCEVLCTQLANRLQGCRTEALVWADLGARSRADFADQCRSDWNRTRLDLSDADLNTSLQICDETQDDLAALSCEEIVALYGPME